MTTDDTYRRAADDAYRTIRQAVLKTTREAGAEPLAGVRAARVYEHAAARLAAGYVSRARADGTGWLEIGRALGLNAEGGYDVAVAAYERSRGADGFGVRLPFWFTCSSCGQQVTDRGPYIASPMDQEEGHAGDCARFAEAVRAYRAQWDEEDETDE